MAFTTNARHERRGTRPGSPTGVVTPGLSAIIPRKARKKWRGALLSIFNL
jgi:hypothetical protein